MICSAVATSPYQRWHDHFSKNRESSARHPWDDCHRLTDAERRAVSRSIQQFQLGEWARGRGLIRRARAHPVFAGDSSFIPALELFIDEEQIHSGLLGRFMEREHIPKLSDHWLDGIFRRLRKLAGLEACVTVLVTAEVLALPYYQALRDATGSALLRSICIRILCDEVAHLRYQALTIGLIRRALSRRSIAIHEQCHSMLFRCTSLLLWQQHRKVFRAAGWNFSRFWNDAERTFAHLECRVRQTMLGREAALLEDRRLD